MFSTAECAPTLAPWKPYREATTSETVHHKHSDNHAIYDINDIVHFEDNDIVMRDAKTTDEQNKMDNSLDMYKPYDYKKMNILLDVDNALNIKDDEGKVDEIKSDEVKDVKCECEHGGGCVGGVCLCPVGYAGVKCEITLDLKVCRYLAFCFFLFLTV